MARSVCLLTLLAVALGLVVWVALEWSRLPGARDAAEGAESQGLDPLALAAQQGPDEETESQEPVRTPFAADRVPNEGPPPVELDGKRALDYLKAVCDLGPRMSGTAGMRRQQALLQEHFEKLGGTVRLQKFTARQLSRKEPVPMANLVVSWHPERKRRVILCSHYDTRPIADQEPDPRKWRERFVSANDGGSGVALLMELAHYMKDLKTAVGVDFVFFDGEEYVFARSDQYFFGSQHFAKTWRATNPRPEYGAAILLDMIAGKRPHFPVEGYSGSRAGPLVVQIWKIAKDQGCIAFEWREGDHVQDDHLALLSAGIPAIDIIDFHYPFWHRLGDVPENCAEDGILQVGRVLTVWLQRLQ